MKTESKLIIIDTRQKQGDSSSNSSFYFDIGTDINIKSFAIKSISLVNAQFNVNSFNNTFNLLVGATPYTVTVDVGQYTTTTLLTALTTAVNTAITPETVAFAQNTTTQIITATFSTSSTIQDSPLGRLLGFTGAEGAGTTVVASGFPTLLGTYSYILTSGVLGQMCRRSDDEQYPVLAVVPNDVDFGSQIIYEPNDVQYGLIKRTGLVGMSSIDIQVRDDNFNIVDLHGTHVQIVLKVWSRPSTLTNV
jgi:hypothetical protein